MIDLSSHIEYLLISHDCVVAPGLGAFLVHDTPASYDIVTNRFNPPVCSLGFNQDITMNDGLLVESVARQKKISLESARVEVEMAVSSFRHQLIAMSTLAMGNIGVMTYNEGTIVFEPSGTSAVTLRYYGLRPIDIMPLESDAIDSPEMIEMPVKRELSMPLPLKIAASIIIAMVACGLFYTTNNLVDRHTNYASLDSGLSVRVDNSGVVMDGSADVSREIELNIANPKIEVSAEPVVEANPETPGHYLLVVGSFPRMHQAQKFIGDDNRLAVIEMEGRFRVYAASAPTNRDAHNKANELRDEFPSVWICRR